MKKLRMIRRFMDFMVPQYSWVKQGKYVETKSEEKRVKSENGGIAARGFRGGRSPRWGLAHLLWGGCPGASVGRPGLLTWAPLGPGTR